MDAVRRADGGLGEAGDRLLKFLASLDVAPVLRGRGWEP